MLNVTDYNIDACHDWLRRTADFSHLDLKVSDILEKHATPEARASHIDLADWLMEYLEDKNAKSLQTIIFATCKNEKI